MLFNKMLLFLKKEIALTLQKRGFALGNKPLLLHVILY